MNLLETFRKALENNSNIILKDVDRDIQIRDINGIHPLNHTVVDNTYSLINSSHDKIILVSVSLYMRFHYENHSSNELDKTIYYITHNNSNQIISETEYDGLIESIEDFGCLESSVDIEKFL